MPFLFVVLLRLVKGSSCAITIIGNNRNPSWRNGAGRVMSRVKPEPGLNMDLVVGDLKF